jgi:Tol biopolymer transport system component
MIEGASMAGRCVASAVAAFACLAVALVASGSATATFPGRNGLIAFESDRHPLLDNPQFFAVDARGGIPELLTGVAQESALGATSPDRKLVAFTRSGTWQLPPEIWLMNADGSDRRRLVNGWHPVWSSDGKRIAYEAGHGDCGGGYRCGHTVGLWTIRPDGSEIRLVSAAARNPSWSPSGQRLVFETGLDPYGTAHGIRVANPDGTNARSLAREGRLPAWSPSGRAIAYSSGGATHIVRPNGTGRRRLGVGAWLPIWSAGGMRLAYICEKGALCTVDASGRHRRVVARGVETQSTELKYDAPIAAWSPRGLRLAYARPEGIFVVNANGRGRRRVARRTNGILLDRLRWSADGRRLLFAQWRDGNDLEIYTVSADGSGVRALTDNAFADSRPSWAPDGTRLAFMRKKGRSAYDIWVVDASGGHERLVASNGVNPEWTADGRIVFSRGKWTYCVSVAGGDERVLMPARDQNSLSPDGTKVAFFGDGPRFRQLFVAAPNGAGTRPLTPIDLEERLSWSPDSSRIAFLGMDDAGTRGIDIIRLDGGGSTRVVTTPNAYPSASFSPDGTALAFNSGTGYPTSQIEIIGLDGSGRRVVTASRGQNSEPTWQPLPR